MRRSQSVGVTLGIAFVCVGLSASAQQKKPHKGAAAPAAATAAAPAATTKALPHAKPGAHTTTTTKPGDTKPVDAEAGHPAPTGHQVVEHESHIEFDERMVRGQSAAGAIYLFNRSPNEFKSIVKVPEGFRGRTIALVAPRGGTP
jgi:hypothetical protein